MNGSPADLAKWARDRAAAIASPFRDTVYAGRDELLAIADTLDYLTKERDRLRYLDSRTDLSFVYDAGDSDVGIWPLWTAYSEVTKQMVSFGGSLGQLADDLRLPEPVEPQTPASPATE